ncbi:tetratricopeptide repeat protein [bacterium]|nr:tetratricopeptide repeat protein [bacterium]
MRNTSFLYFLMTALTFLLCVCAGNACAGDIQVAGTAAHQQEIRELLDQARQASSGESLARSITLLEKAYALDAFDPETVFMLGLAYCGNGEYERGIALLEDVHEMTGEPLTLEPLKNAYFMLGMRYTAEQKMIEAEDLFSRVIAIDSAHAKAYCNRGICRVINGKYAEALDDFSQARAGGFRSIEMELNRASALEKSGNADRAIDIYKELLAVEPGCAPAHYNAAVLLEKKAANQPDMARFINESINHYKRSVELDPSMYEAAFNLSRIYYARQNLSLAIVWIRKALEINDSLEQAHLLLAQLYFEKGAYNNALAQVELMEEKGYHFSEMDDIRSNIYSITGKETRK